MQQLDAVRTSRKSVHATGDRSALALVTRDDASGPGTHGQPTNNAAIPRIDTHWSRIFYYDLFAADTGDSTRRPDDLESKETFDATDPASRDFASRHIRSPIQAAVILLAIFIAMYLAVAGVMYVLASPDAAAVTTDGLIAPAAVPSLDLARRNSRAVLKGDRPR
jgi:hypothetical protein